MSAGFGPKSRAWSLLWDRDSSCWRTSQASFMGEEWTRYSGTWPASGFDAEWESFEAAAVGAPHLRDRVFIVAYRPPSPLPDTFGDLLRQQWERLGQQHREPGATEPRDDGAACVADAARNGRNSWSRPSGAGIERTPARTW